MKNRTVIPILFAALFIAGCTHHYIDSPAARRALDRSVADTGSLRIAGQPWKEFFEPRVSYLLPDTAVEWIDKDSYMLDAFSGSGRGAAISADGYFLSANHVVETESPYLFELGVPPGVHRGRIVRRFPEADLALTKFDIRPPAYFDRLTSAPRKHTRVYSADTSGFSIGPERIGNGPFGASGKIVAILRPASRPGITICLSDMPVRGGMSGAPIADESGQLAGILTAAFTAPFYPPRFTLTRSVMLDPHILRDLIAEDRKQHPSP